MALSPLALAVDATGPRPGSATDNAPAIVTGVVVGRAGNAGQEAGHFTSMGYLATGIPQSMLQTHTTVNPFTSHDGGSQPRLGATLAAVEEED